MVNGTTGTGKEAPRNNLFNLHGRVAIITGGAGFLGQMHAETIAENGGIPVILDVNEQGALDRAKKLQEQFDVDALGLKVDCGIESEVLAAAKVIKQRYGRVDILINNAANNPAVGKNGPERGFSRFEDFSVEQWQEDISSGLTSIFICSKIFGGEMANNGGGVILNMGSELAAISPDQRLYRKEGIPEDKQSIKPITYSANKGGIVSMTRYMACYWAKKNVRVNSLSPGGVLNGQDPTFLSRINQLIPLGRMCNRDELRGPVLFLVSDASTYVTGANLAVDGGRTII